VQFLPWGEEAFGRARREEKPVFLFIGSRTSELSRAMGRQTFANADVAAMLNQNFVCVLVDREEQPALAVLYQAYVRQVKQVSGWPLNVWLTPELQPFEGATYLPPTEEWGKASFMKVAQQAREAWSADPKGCRTRAAEVATQLAPVSPPVPAVTPEKIKSQLTAAAEAWRATFDATHGGFSEPPKNPEPELLRFLLRQSAPDREAALVTLRAIATGALRDPLDGGFFRYASDAEWRLPYQQKVLSDQARLALAFLDAAQGGDKPLFTAAARGALDYVLARLARPDGSFAAGEDATADEFAGYYAWTAADIDAALGADSTTFKAAHGVEAGGNVSADADASGRLQGKNILRRASPGDGSSAAAATRLLALRDQRPAPPRDDRMGIGAHGLVLAALARAGVQLDEARYLKGATRLFAVLKKEVSPSGDLPHLRGFTEPAGPADYAALALGCRELARATKSKTADELVTRLLATAHSRFLDPVTGRYYATPTALPTGIFVRPLALGDAPSAEALTLMAGAPPEQAKVIAAGLLASLEEAGGTGPGDTLLALALLP